jgi:hypothetical protein
MGIDLPIPQQIKHQMIAGTVEKVGMSNGNAANVLPGVLLPFPNLDR